METNFQAIDGYAYGAIQPSALLRFRGFADAPPRFITNLELLLSYLPEVAETSPFEGDDLQVDVNTAAPLLLRVLDSLNRHCGDQRFTPIKVFQENNQSEYALPTLSPALVGRNLETVYQFLEESKGGISKENVKALADNLKSACRRFLPGGTNAGNLIAAAADRRIPFKIFANRYLIFGYGSGSTIFHSSITDRESHIGVELASNKIATNRFLGLSGFPVADQAVIRSIKDAIHFANKIGYPVVLKPANEAQGRGVFANIQNESDLKHCFVDINNNYKDIIIEKHVLGDHYRIDFMGDKLIKAVRRLSASVVGDGKTTLENLVNIFNRDPDRLDPNSSMQPVKFDEDLHRAIKNQGFALSDIPKMNKRVVLNSVSNLSRGGEQAHVENTVHPENYELCRSIARTMRLAVLGIDLLSPDLSKPWYTNGAVVCEVNAQPQLGKSRTDVYWTLLSEYVRPLAIIKLKMSNDAVVQNEPLFDTRRSEVVLSLAPREIFANGCPTQYFNHLEIADDVSEEDRRKLERMLISVIPEGHRYASTPDL